MKKVNKVLCIVISMLFLVNNVVYADVKITENTAHDSAPMNLAAESHLAPMNTPEFLDIAKLTARLLLLSGSSEDFFRGTRNQVETLISVRDAITKKTGNPDVIREASRLIYYREDKKILAEGKTMFFPCSILSKGFNNDRNTLRWYIARVRTINDNKCEFDFIKARDCDMESFDQETIKTLLENPDICKILAKKDILPEEKKAIARFVEQQNEADIVIADAIWLEKETRIDANSDDIRTIENFLKHLSNNKLQKEFTRLVKNRQIMEIPGLKKPHAGGVGIYLVNESDFGKKHQDQIVHELFAKCGLLHEENDLLVKIFNEWLLEATIVGEGRPWKHIVHSLNEGYIEKKLTEWGNKELFKKIETASFENRWKNPYTIDYYGDNSKEALTQRIKKLLKDTIKPGKMKNIDEHTLYKFEILQMLVKYQKLADVFFEVCENEDSTFLIQKCNATITPFGIQVYNYGSTGREIRKKMKEFLESKIPKGGGVQNISFETLKKETGATYEEISYLLPELCKGRLFQNVRSIDLDGIWIALDRLPIPDAPGAAKKGIVRDKKNQWKRELEVALKELLIKERAEEYLKTRLTCGEGQVILLRDWLKETEPLSEDDAEDLIYSLCSGCDSEYRMESCVDWTKSFDRGSPRFTIYRYTAQEYAEVKEKKEIIGRFLLETFTRDLSGGEGSLLLQLMDFDPTDGLSKPLTKEDIANLLPEVCFAADSGFVLEDLFEISTSIKINNFAKSIEVQKSLLISEKIKKKTAWRESLRKTCGVSDLKRGRPESPGKNADDTRLLILSSKYLRALLNTRGWFALNDYVTAYQFTGEDLGFTALPANPETTLRSDLSKLAPDFLKIDKAKLEWRFRLTKKGDTAKKDFPLLEDLDDVTKIDTASREINAGLSLLDDGPVFFMPQELITPARCKTLAKEYNQAKFVSFNQHNLDNLDSQLKQYASRRKVVLTIGAEYEGIKDVYARHKNLMPLNFSRENMEDVLNLNVRDARRKELEKTVISIALLTGALPAEGYASTCSYSVLHSLLSMIVSKDDNVETYISNLVAIAAGDTEKLSYLVKTQLNPIMPYNVEEIKFIVNILIAA